MASEAEAYWRLGQGIERLGTTVGGIGRAGQAHKEKMGMLGIKMAEIEANAPMVKAKQIKARQEVATYERGQKPFDMEEFLKSWARDKPAMTDIANNFQNVFGGKFNPETREFIKNNGTILTNYEMNLPENKNRAAALLYGSVDPKKYSEREVKAGEQARQDMDRLGETEEEKTMGLDMWRKPFKDTIQKGKAATVRLKDEEGMMRRYLEQLQAARPHAAGNKALESMMDKRIASVQKKLTTLETRGYTEKQVLAKEGREKSKYEERLKETRGYKKGITEEERGRKEEKASEKETRDLIAQIMKERRASIQKQLTTLDTRAYKEGTTAKIREEKAALLKEKRKYDEEIREESRIYKKGIAEEARIFEESKYKKRLKKTSADIEADVLVKWMEDKNLTFKEKKILDIKLRGKKLTPEEIKTNAKARWDAKVESAEENIGRKLSADEKRSLYISDPFGFLAPGTEEATDKTFSFTATDKDGNKVGWDGSKWVPIKQ